MVKRFLIFFCFCFFLFCFGCESLKKNLQILIGSFNHWTAYAKDQVLNANILSLQGSHLGIILYKKLQKIEK